MRVSALVLLLAGVAAPLAAQQPKPVSTPTAVLVSGPQVGHLDHRSAGPNDRLCILGGQRSPAGDGQEQQAGQKRSHNTDPVRTK